MAFNNNVYASNEEGFVWYNDVTGTFDGEMEELGHMHFHSPADQAGLKRVVAKGNNTNAISIGYGSFGPWTGDWSKVVGSDIAARRSFAPTSAQWVRSGAHGWGSHWTAVRDSIVQYRRNFSLIQSIRDGNIAYGTNNVVMTLADLFNGSQTYTSCADLSTETPIDNIHTFGLILDNIESQVPGCFTSADRQADISNIKVSASPQGGDTHGQLKAAQQMFQDRNGMLADEKPMNLHSYTPHANLPAWGSGLTYEPSTSIALNGWIEAWMTDSMLPDPWAGTCSNLDSIRVLDPLAWLDKVDAQATESKDTFPMFTTLDPDTYSARLSYYQPHWLDGGDNNSAVILRAAGDFLSPNGGTASGDNGATTITSQFMQLSLPTVESKNEFWITSMSKGYVGSYGITGSARPMHDLIVEVHPAVNTHYTTEKTEGPGAFSFYQYGPSYSQLPVAPGDWAVTGFHANMKSRNFLASFYSLNHSVFFETSQAWGIEVTSFAEPYAAIQYEDFGGMGAQFQGNDLDLKGYRYGYSGGNLDAPKLAFTDSRKVSGGIKNITILPIAIPTGSNKLRIWDMAVTPTGLTLEAGRFASLSLPNSGKTEKYEGPLFLSTPSFSANLYVLWITGSDTDCIAPFIVQVKG